MKNEDGSIKWIQQPFPVNITDLLMVDNDNNGNFENNFDDFGSDIVNNDNEDESWDGTRVKVISASML